MKRAAAAIAMLALAAGTGRTSFAAPQEATDLATAVAYERHQFASVKANLAGEVRQLGEHRARSTGANAQG